MKITDCHVHPRAVENYTEEVNHLLRHMRRHGIARMIASDLGDKWLAFPDAQTLRIANDRLQKACQANPEELYYLVYLNPQLNNWREEFERHCVTACGVKLWISLWTEENHYRCTVEVLQAAAAAGLPVLIHTFERTDGVSTGAVGVEGIIELARSVPACRIVAAHSCGSWRKAIKHAKEFPENIVFDISGSYPERGMVDRLVAAFGADRLLYGSDAYGRSFGSQLSKVMHSTLAAADMQKILHENATAIFKLPPLAEEKTADLPQWSIPQADEDHFCFVGQSEYFDHAVTCDDLERVSVRKRLFAVDLNVLGTADRVAANRKFAQKALAYKKIMPLAAVNLAEPLQALRQLEDMENFAGIWISPYLDNYKLDYAASREFFDFCAERKIGIWINTALSDDRFRCSKLRSRVVSFAEIAAFIHAAPENKYVFQAVHALAEASGSFPDYCRWECSRLSDGEYSAESLIRDRQGKVENLLWGSEYPFRDYRAVEDVLLGKI